MAVGRNILLQPSRSPCTLSVSTYGVLHGFEILIIHGHCTSVPEIAPKNNQRLIHHATPNALIGHVRTHLLHLTLYRY